MCMWVCVRVCVCELERQRAGERELASEEIEGSILSRQEVWQSQREREQDTQQIVERETKWEKGGRREEVRGETMGRDGWGAKKYKHMRVEDGKGD